MFNNYNYFTMNNLETILESDTEGAQVLEPEMLDNSSKGSLGSAKGSSQFFQSTVEPQPKMSN